MHTISFLWRMYYGIVTHSFTTSMRYSSRAVLFLIGFVIWPIVAMSKKSRRPSIKVEENLETEEQLLLVEAVLYKPINLVNLDHLHQSINSTRSPNANVWKEKVSRSLKYDFFGPQTYIWTLIPITLPRSRYTCRVKIWKFSSKVKSILLFTPLWLYCYGNTCCNVTVEYYAWYIYKTWFMKIYLTRNPENWRSDVLHFVLVEFFSKIKIDSTSACWKSCTQRSLSYAVSIFLAN